MRNTLLEKKLKTRAKESLSNYSVTLKFKSESFELTSLVFRGFASPLTTLVATMLNGAKAGFADDDVEVRTATRVGTAPFKI